MWINEGMNNLAVQNQEHMSKFKCYGLFYFTSLQNIILALKTIYEMV